MAKIIVNIKYSSTKPLVFSSIKANDIYNVKVSCGVETHIITTNLPIVSNFNIEINSSAQVRFTSFITSKKITRFFSQVNLYGKGAQVYQQVVVLGSDESGTDLDLSLNHKAPDTLGRLAVRRIQTEKSASALYGMLRIASQAHGADSYLSDKVILLGNKSKTVSVPSLEIKTDDVHASHSATVAQLSPDELFYLRSRGLTEDAARVLLLKVFVGSVLVGIPDDLKNSIINKLSQLKH
jgi:Fe-S cluster assembly protein SufD